jgi:hypothetical protein
MAFKRGGIEAAQQLKERDFATLKNAKRNSLLFARRFLAPLICWSGASAAGDASEKCGRSIQKRLEQFPVDTL